jgi:uncharacterized repeat protein (TIGR03803 family)
MLVFVSGAGSLAHSRGCRAAGFSTLYSFGNQANGGACPYGSLTLSGSSLYGVSERGGSAGQGTIFSINTDGSGYQVLHSFGGTSADGANPYGCLALAGTALYGMTAQGGLYGNGTIFSINTDGSGYQVLHSFAGPPNDGANPYGCLTLVGSTLYGMTAQGGSAVLWGGSYANLGTVFGIATDGTGYKVLYNFGTATSKDGGKPYGSLTAAGSALYGMTSLGGSFGQGTIFSIDPDGTNYGVVYSFGAAFSDGAHPYGSLTLWGSTLFAMTQGGGACGYGTIFRINTDGSQPQVLHSFGSVAQDGTYPLGSLTLLGSTLYGMAPTGGAGGSGEIFQINNDGSGYELLYSLTTTAGLTGLAYPTGGLADSNAILYGTTVTGGANGAGSIFSLVLPTTCDGLWQNAKDCGKGWSYLNWFGYFAICSSTGGLGWIYHMSLGWLYADATSTQSIWFYDPQWDGAGGWWWTSSDVFPWLYSATEGSWLYYDNGSSAPRWFGTLSGQWTTH